MAVEVHTLDNGLRVVLYRHKIDSVYMTLINRGSARFERPEELGISHILEHLLVRDPEMIYKIESLGEGLSNAETGSEEISYYFSFPHRNTLRGAKLMFRLWTTPISAREFELERRTITTEYIEETADPNFALDDLFRSTALRGHPLEQDDTRRWQKNLPNLTLEQFAEFRQKTQCGRNTVLTVVGNVPTQPFLDVVRNGLDGMSAGELLPIKKFPLTPLEKFTVVKDVRPIDQVHCLLGFAHSELNARERLARSVLSTYLGGCTLFSSVLFRKIREERALVYYIESDTETFYDSGAWVVKWICAPGDVETVLNLVLEEIVKISRDGMPLKEFRRSRHILALNRESELEEPVTISEALAEETIRYGKPSDPARWPAQVRRARQEEVIEFAQKHLNPQRAVLAMFGPVENLEPRILV